MKHHAWTWIALIAIASSSIAAGACGGKEKEKERDEPAEQPGGGSQPFGNLDFLGSLLTSQLDKPGPYDEPRASSEFDAAKDHMAVLELEGPVIELTSFSLLSGMSGGTELSAITGRLRQLAADEHVKGMLLRAGNLSMSMGTAEELRAALIQFKGKSERKLVCHTEGVSNTTYYVLSACDSLGLAPGGEIVVSGVAAMPIHLKGLLDKVGIAADFLQIGGYKGAAEPLTRDSPSREMRETLDAILDQAYDTMVRGIAQGRKLEPDAVARLIDTAMFQGEEAVKAGLADVVAVYEAYRDQVLGGIQWTAIKLHESAKPDIGKLMQFVGLMPRPRPLAPHVTVVYAVGNVIDGKGSGLLGARGEIASRTLAAALRALAADDNVKAVVLRVDSGGGSALASEIIWHAIAEVKSRKPVVVSMAGMAASGGYYIGCGANKIFALENTLTGSIGVVGGKLALRGVLDNLGVKAYPMARGKRALVGSAIDPWSADERSAVERMMQGVYRTFVSRVAAGRGKRYEDIDAIARGRVWTGAAARERGLVDEIGGLDAAIAAARELGGVAQDVDVEIYPPEPTLVDILNSFARGSAPGVVESATAEAVAQIARELGVVEARVVADTIAQLLLLRDARILAAAFFPAALR